MTDDLWHRFDAQTGRWVWTEHHWREFQRAAETPTEEALILDVSDQVMICAVTTEGLL